MTHRDGHRLWVTANFNRATDPDTAVRSWSGRFRDVTAERYVVQRQTALASLNERLAQADSLDDAVLGAAESLCRVWDARRVLAATFAQSEGGAAPQLIWAGDGSAQWSGAPGAHPGGDHVAA